jgi:hypothetical protein
VSETPAEVRARLLREANKRARTDLAARARTNPYRPAPDVAEIQAEATARNRTAIPPPVMPDPAASALPPQARAAADLPMKNPPVHRAQIKPIPGAVNKEGFLARVRKLPPPEKLSAKTMMAVARSLVWAIGKEIRGIAMISYSGLATASQCSRTQAWRAIKAFRAAGLLDIFNVVAREDNELYLEPNAYSLRGFTEAIPAVIDAVKDSVTGAFERASEQIRRFARVWDMRPNRGGRGVDNRTHPAPT